MEPASSKHALDPFTLRMGDLLLTEPGELKR